MTAWKPKGGLEKYYDRIVDGVTARGYKKTFASPYLRKPEVSPDTGFPGSHVASFALLVYASRKVASLSFIAG